MRLLHSATDHENRRSALSFTSEMRKNKFSEDKMFGRNNSFGETFMMIC